MRKGIACFLVFVCLAACHVNVSASSGDFKSAQEGFWNSLAEAGVTRPTEAATSCTLPPADPIKAHYDPVPETTASANVPAAPSEATVNLALQIACVAFCAINTILMVILIAKVSNKGG